MVQEQQSKFFDLIRTIDEDEEVEDLSEESDAEVEVSSHSFPPNQIKIKSSIVSAFKAKK